MYFEIYKEGNTLSGLLASGSPTAGQWRWRLKAANNQVIASGESYHNKTDCMHALALLQQTTVATPIRELQ